MQIEQKHVYYFEQGGSYGWNIILNKGVVIARMKTISGIKARAGLKTLAEIKLLLE